MATQTEPTEQHRVPLSPERVLNAAVKLADEEGLESLTMRRLAEKLGVEAMSLYYHIANKEALLDGIAEVIVAEIIEAASRVEAPDPGDDWKTAMRMRILAAREVMLRHRWAPKVLETRTTMNASLLQYYHSLLEIFRAGGVSWDLAHHSMHALGSRALGFTQELFEPASDEEEEASDEMMAQMAEDLPLMVEMLSEIVHDDPDTTIGWCDDQTEFEFGLDLLLEGIENQRARGRA
jgi:AcrR family transcriptional regulator